MAHRDGRWWSGAAGEKRRGRGGRNNLTSLYKTENGETVDGDRQGQDGQSHKGREAIE